MALTCAAAVRALLAAALLAVTISALNAPAGGHFRGFSRGHFRGHSRGSFEVRRSFGGHSIGGHSGHGSGGHGCRFDWSRDGSSHGSGGLQRFIAAKSHRMQEICGAAAPQHTSQAPHTGQCDCRPAWQCPYRVRGPHARPCHLPDHGLGFGARVGICCQPQATPVFDQSEIITSITVPAAQETVVEPSPVARTQATTTFTFGFTTVTTTTTTTAASSDITPGLCRALVLCPAAVVDPSAFTTCQLQDGALGVLCEQPFDVEFAARGLRTDERQRAFAADQIVSEEFIVAPGGGEEPASEFMQAALTEATQAVQAQAAQEAALATPAGDSSVAIFNLNFQSGSQQQQLGRRGLQQLLAVAALQRQIENGVPIVQLSSETAGAADAASFSADAEAAGVASAAAAGSGSFPGSPPVNSVRIPGCTPDPEPVCGRSRYRTANGECNNLEQPRRGRSDTGFKRLLASTFADGVYELRNTSVTGAKLPNPRLISSRVVESISNELSGFTLSVMQWGQFIDHDLDHALVFQATGKKGDGKDDERAIQCCPPGGRVFPTIPLHPRCSPIEIPAYDPFFGRFGQRCMSFVRSLPSPDPDCNARPATPINALTAYLDAGNIYGSKQDKQNQLRTFREGLLKTSPGHLLPTALPTDEECMPGARVCYRSGDGRVNEQSGLTVMHTLMTREHNRVATALRRRHGDWDDERTFQEARRIVIAEWQHVIYNEWLPIVLGFDFARDHDLLPLQNGFSFDYDPTLDASIANEFATAAFRFGHSMVRDMYDLINAQGAVTRTVNLTDTFFNPIVVAESLVEHARTLVERRPETFDHNVITALRERLFASHAEFGMDLIALNIQRGRDHGIPSYTTALQACNGVSVYNWEDLRPVMDQRAIDNLRSVYADPRDVDLFIGGLSERRARGAQVGPTFQCLIGQQFFDVRYGDRFFYDAGGMEHSFTDAQLAEIRKSSWARILCDTLGAVFGGDFSQVQPLAFVESGVVPNFMVQCNSYAIPRVDLSVF